MNDPDYDDLLPNEISDEASYVMSQFLFDLSQACEEKYYTQIRRYLIQQRYESNQPSDSDEIIQLLTKNKMDGPPF